MRSVPDGSIAFWLARGDRYVGIVDNLGIRKKLVFPFCDGCDIDGRRGVISVIEAAGQRQI